MKRTIIIFSSSIILLLIVWTILEINKLSDSYFYGHSYRQNQIVNTVRIHKYGIIGERIKVGILDAGFYTGHSAFKKTNIIKQFDFVRDIPDVFDKDHIYGADHGTGVFSVIGGFQPNKIVGIAYGADFILVRTDINSDRLCEEETLAVKASEWLADNGVNIISTSLSFNKFDNANYYFPSQMNGKISLITRTADSIAANGIIYCCSAGNNYENDWHIIEPPADGFNVIAAGSIDKHGIHSFFSSAGPTSDSRIKPDFTALGEGVYTASYLPKIKQDFNTGHGTSLAAPVIAGIAALVLSAHPGLSSEQVIEAIKYSSTKYDSPDNKYGYGIPDAEKAVSFFGPVFSNTPKFKFDDDQAEIGTYFFSSFGIDPSSVEIVLIRNDSGKEKIVKMIQEDDYYFSADIILEKETDRILFYFRGKDSRGVETKYPEGIAGDRFVIDKKENKIYTQKLN